MKSKLAAFILTTLLLISCQGQTSKTVNTLSVVEYSKILDATPNAQFVDVRTPQEYVQEHIGNAQNINWNDPNFVSNIEKLDKNKPVFLYCKSGGRSNSAATKLIEIGFKEVYNLEGGIMKWNASGKKLSETKSDKIIGICDQEYNDFIKSDKTVVVNFYAEWCAPCKKMAPYITKMEAEKKENLTVKRFDVDQNKTIVDYLKLDGVPVVIVYKDGIESYRNVGYISEEDLKKHL